jgi:hypothetical protein
MDNLAAADRSPFQICEDILGCLKARYNATDHAESWTKLHRSFQEWHELLKARHRRSNLFVPHFVALCRLLEHVYALFPGVVVKEGEHNALVCILAKAEEPTGDSRNTALRLQSVSDCQEEMLNELSRCVLAVMPRRDVSPASCLRGCTRRRIARSLARCFPYG